MRPLLFAGSLLLAAGIASAAPPEIVIENPPEGTPVYGEVEIRAQVTSDEAITRVEFWADGKLVGTATQAPWQASTDLGYDNKPHRLKVLAVTASGLSREALRTTPIVQVDMELAVQLQQLYVSVGNDGGRELRRDHFVILDNGTRQSVVTFERGEVPITAAILLDASQSMQGGRLAKALEGARAFVDGLTEVDKASILLFSDQLVRRTEFASEPRTLLASLEGVEARGGTAVNDHLYLALKGLEGEPGRPVVILLSDGADVHSVLSMRDVLWKVGRSQALVYWIVLQEQGRVGGDTFSSAWRDGEATRKEARALQEAIEVSGGRTISVQKLEDLSSTFAEILLDLRGQYVLGYYPSNLSGSRRWHKVEVRVDEPGVRVRHRGGYFDE
ncbi:MAG TPA: VWA domain-containing protein [Thermoanaerobaculia bacterium]|nr:VWA domain-containing protein [Thermoanaerobaculia bacterium]